MSNIFTFDLQDQNQCQLKKQVQLSIKKQTKQLKQRQNCSPFTFDEFQQSIQNDYTQVNLKTKPLSRRKYETKANKVKNSKQLKKHDNNRDQESQDQDQSQSESQNNTKKQLVSELMPGLEVENLGKNQMEYVCQKKALKVTDMRKFLLTPMGNYKVKAIIRKQGGNLLNFNSKFNVYIQQNNRFIFSITRQGISQYIFSLDNNHISEKKKSYIGKMCANMSGTQFLMFDSGFSPKQTRSLQSCRKQIASIKYSSLSGPRKFHAVVSTNCQGFYALEPDHNILEDKWQKKQRQFLSVLYSKDPELDPQDGNYKLDFKGIVKKASVKNFILGGVQWPDSLIFGKIDNETYIMQIKQPLSVLQAAGICISSIHYKLHWR